MVLVDFSEPVTSPALSPAGSALNPAYSAKQILAEVPAAFSGVYWFDPDGGGPEPPFQAYADMVTDGGGWMLAVNSVSGSEAPSNSIAANLGNPSLTVGHTRDMDYLALNQTAEIRHDIDAASNGIFHGKYVGTYAAMPPSPAFTFLAPSNSSLLASEDGNSFGPATFGSPWYGPTFSSIPSSPSNGFGGPAVFGNPNNIIPAYRIWVRETAPPPAGAQSDFELRGTGSDGLLGTTDDVFISLDSITGAASSWTISFPPLAGGLYRLTVPRCFFSAVLSRTAGADLIVEFDMDPVAPGVQNDLQSPAGPFTVNVVGTLTGGDTLSSYSLGVAYDSAELAAKTASPLTPPSGFDFVLSSLMVSGNQVTRFSAGTLFSPAVTGSFIMGSIGFTPVTPSGTAGDNDVNGFLVAGLDGAFDGGGNPVNVLFASSSVSVPEPLGWRLDPARGNH